MKVVELELLAEGAWHRKARHDVRTLSGQTEATLRELLEDTKRDIREIRRLLVEEGVIAS